MFHKYKNICYNNVRYVRITLEDRKVRYEL